MLILNNISDTAINQNLKREELTISEKSRKENFSTASILKDKGSKARVAITPIIKLSNKRIKSPREGEISPLLERSTHKKGVKSIKKQKTIAVSK